MHKNVNTCASSSQNLSVVHICSIRLKHFALKTMSNGETATLEVAALTAVLESTNMHNVASLFRQIVILFCSKTENANVSVARAIIKDLSKRRTHLQEPDTCIFEKKQFSCAGCISIDIAEI